MNGFIKKSVKTLTLGEKLRKLRSDKRISLNKVSQSTKIQIKYLEYLEQGNYDKLPADVYTKGFLRSYADFLGVDKNILLKLYNKERDIRKNLKKNKKQVLKKTKPLNISYFVFTPKKILIFVTTILIFVGLFFLYKEIGSFASTPRLVVLSPNNNSQVSSNFVSVEGITDKDASVFINNQPILVGDDGKFEENLTLQSGVNFINIKATNKFKKEIIQTITVRYNCKLQEKVASDELSNNDNSNNTSDQPDNQKTPDKNQQGVKIEVRVDPGPVWLSVETDDNTVFKGMLLAGASQTFQAKDKIIINSGNGSATHIKFNGKDIGTLSKKSSAIHGVVFTKDTKY